MRERNICVCLPLTRPLVEFVPATQARALTGNRTDDPLVLWPVLQPHQLSLKGGRGDMNFSTCCCRQAGGSLSRSCRWGTWNFESLYLLQFEF